MKEFSSDPGLSKNNPGQSEINRGRNRRKNVEPRFRKISFHVYVFVWGPGAPAGLKQVRGEGAPVLRLAGAPGHNCWLVYVFGRSRKPRFAPLNLKRETLTLAPAVTTVFVRNPRFAPLNLIRTEPKTGPSGPEGPIFE